MLQMDNAGGWKRVSPALDPPSDESFEALEPPPEPTEASDDEPAPSLPPRAASCGYYSTSNLSFAFRGIQFDEKEIALRSDLLLDLPYFVGWIGMEGENCQVSIRAGPSKAI